MSIESTSRSSRHEPYWLALRFPEAWFECRCPEEERHDRPPAVLLGGGGRGGRVAAIGNSELRYVKRGQAVVLRMPRG